jgi:hypothetical protein
VSTTTTTTTTSKEETYTNKLKSYNIRKEDDYET